MTVQIKVNHNPTASETWSFLSDEFQETVNQYNRAIEIGDKKGESIYFSKASLLEDMLVNLFDAEVPSWYE
jgi:hypothetical protein